MSSFGDDEIAQVIASLERIATALETQRSVPADVSAGKPVAPSGSDEEGAKILVRALERIVASVHKGLPIGPIAQTALDAYREVRKTGAVKMLVDGDWLRSKVDADPDTETEASSVWIPWNGGECPCPGEDIEVRLKDGRIMTGRSRTFVWEHGYGDTDIDSYRIVTPAPEPIPLDIDPEQVRPELRELLLGGRAHKPGVNLRDLGFVGRVSDEARAEIEANERRAQRVISTEPTTRKEGDASSRLTAATCDEAPDPEPSGAVEWPDDAAVVRALGAWYGSTWSDPQMSNDEDKFDMREALIAAGSAPIEETTDIEDMLFKWLQARGHEFREDTDADTLCSLLDDHEAALQSAPIPHDWREKMKAWLTDEFEIYWPGAVHYIKSKIAEWEKEG